MVPGVTVSGSLRPPRFPCQRYSRKPLCVLTSTASRLTPASQVKHHLVIPTTDTIKSNTNKYAIRLLKRATNNPGIYNGHYRLVAKMAKAILKLEMFNENILIPPQTAQNWLLN